MDEVKRFIVKAEKFELRENFFPTKIIHMWKLFAQDEYEIFYKTLKRFFAEKLKIEDTDKILKEIKIIFNNSSPPKEKIIKYFNSLKKDDFYVKEIKDENNTTFYSYS